MAFMALAHVAHGQAAIDLEANKFLSASTLPQRNLLIEVRQVISSEADESHARQRHDAVNSRQQVLVLNGRSARIGLRNSVPFRLVQTVFHNGTMVVVPGTVMLEAGTGFNALARWDGQAAVELAISATQSQGSYASQTTSTSTVLIVGLGDWVTVAQSDQQSMGASTDGARFDNSEQTRGTQVQVRVTVR